MTDHLIDEVDEALRRERIENFWRKSGQYVVAGSVIVLLLTIGMVIWQEHKNSQRLAWSQEFLSARTDIDREAYPNAEKTLSALAESASDDMGILAHLWLAQVRMRQHNADGAQEALSAIQGEGIYPDLAQLLSLSLAYEEEQPTPQTFHYTALEAQATALLEAGETDEAAARFKEIAEDALTPDSMRERANLILGSLSHSATQSAEKKE